ncbi:SLC13 family permease [Calidifontimicrobium sp. SYSU G02091]|uniref:SLC13 family permease n=1 Tax=Calidifontimicrobium sp. SYSU G02091 TaxID=2926421 RepID=UPI001F534493|nr:SLC13 family permease [Calidifontimicrobium sp. SYSU G02091]
MTWQQVAVFVGLAALVVELLRGKRAPAAVFASVAFAFVLLDLVSVQKGLAQLTNSGLVTVVVLLLLSVVLDRSHLLETMAGWLVRGPYRWALAKLYVATAAYSAFLNNTAVVASLIGPLRSLRTHAPSRLLMPMCFAASLGGILTLVGTSTNLLVNSLVIGQGMPALHIFDLFPVGILIVLACGATMVLLYPRLLPAQPPAEETSSDYFLEATVRPDSPLIGKTVEAAGLRNLAHLYLAEIVRDGFTIAPVQPDRMLRAGDLLVFTGDLTRLDVLTRFEGLETHGQHYRLPLDNLVEVVIAADSTLARRTLKDVNFRAQFDAAVIAVRRGSERLRGPIANVPLEVGDTLVLVVGNDFEKRNNLQRNFVIVSRRQVQKFTDPRKGLLAMAGFVGAVALAALGVVDLLKALLVLLAAFLLLGLAKPADLRRNMPYAIILIIASSLVISEVMVSSGAAVLLAQALLAGIDAFGPYGALALILVVTWILTELMSNNAAAALSFPVALGVAQTTGLDPQPFVMAVIYGASCSFLTPYGYQTNLMVMSPGRYTLRDFARAGAPLALVYQATALVAIPVFFPLR